MKNTHKFVSDLVTFTLPQWLIHFLWFIKQNAKRSEPQLLFVLTRTDHSQRIQWKMHELSYEQEILLSCPEAVETEVIIREEGGKDTMMLAEEAESSLRQTATGAPE